MERRGYTFGELLIMTIALGAFLGLAFGGVAEWLGGR